MKKYKSQLKKLPHPRSIDVIKSLAHLRGSSIGNNYAEAFILKRFIEHQEKLKQKILDSEDLLEQNAVISSPANPKIVYKLDAAFKIILAHEERHLQQAKKILEIQQSNL